MTNQQPSLQSEPPLSSKRADASTSSFVAADTRDLQSSSSDVEALRLRPVTDYSVAEVRERMRALHAAGVPARPHVLGFIQFPLWTAGHGRTAPGIRLNVWPGGEIAARLCRQRVAEGVHHHPFDMVARLLHGALEDTQWTVERDPSGNYSGEVMDYGPAEAASAQTTNERYAVKRKSATVYRKGDVYTMSKADFHSSVLVEAPTVTLLSRLDFDPTLPLWSFRPCEHARPDTASDPPEEFPQDLAWKLAFDALELI